MMNIRKTKELDSKDFIKEKQVTELRDSETSVSVGGASFQPKK